ncbi:DUF6147 family protein [Ruminococcus sp. CLA-AA-H200]|uniref:DUF6147 family protein n=1 Tax=Ruminococcus turbiniformis TaxID=2881258 RepID=A0ABS8FZW1_9FIRM|nr:DUF6147 family protein [Ruminococcus turbiniformis]MCC2255580.1 DUF6147 family protein [Ruminococcus turbiniformis]
MKKRILSVLVSVAAFSTMIFVPGIDVTASDSEPIMVDGSYLTHEDSSTGNTLSNARGEYLMTGECSISKAGLTRVYSYASTTANYSIDYIMTIGYVEQYHPDVEKWGQVDYYYDDIENTYYLSLDKSVKVDRGYYYRTRANHIVRHNGVYEETASATNGIFLP